jgi:hypothetical protein
MPLVREYPGYCGEQVALTLEGTLWVTLYRGSPRSIDATRLLTTP